MSAGRGIKESSPVLQNNYYLSRGRTQKIHWEMGGGGQAGNNFKSTCLLTRC